MVLVRAKLGPAAAPHFAISRPRLTTRVDACWDHRLTMVVAPAGYGKSVLLGQWHERAGDRVAWVGIDERDHDPVRLARHLLRSLADVEPGLGERAAKLVGAPGSHLSDEVIDLLLDDLGQVTEPIALVLEDLDRVDRAPVVDGLARLAEEAPPALHVVVAARRDPPMSTHRLRVAGHLAEIRAHDLAFTPDESDDTIAALIGHRLDASALDRLQQATEGWPVAVQLAGLAIRNVDPNDEPLTFGTPDQHTVAYLSSEVLATLRPELRRFLLDVSVLDELHPDLCDAIGDRTNSAKLLEELRSDGLFVVPLGGESPGFRLHRLVREMLRHELATDDSARPAQIGLRAATWCLEAGDVPQAAEYLIAARAWDRLEALIHDHAADLWESGEMESALPWMQAIPATVRRSKRRLLLTEAALQLLAGRPDASASILYGLERDGSLTDGEQMVVDAFLVGLVEVATPSPTVLERAERALDLVSKVAPEDVPDVLQATDVEAVRCLVRFGAAKVRLYTGAPHALDDAVAAMGAPLSTSVVYRVHAASTTALIQALAHGAGAETEARRAQSLGEASLGEESPATDTAVAALAVAARDRGDLDLAVELIDPALARSIRWRRWPLATLLVAERALVELSRGDARAALLHVERGRRLTTMPLTRLVADRYEAIDIVARSALGRMRDVAPGRRESRDRRAGWELSLVEIAVAVASEDLHRARTVLDQWPGQIAPMGRLEHEVARALVEQASGDAAAARNRISDVLEATRDNGLVGPFLCGGAPTVELLSEVARQRRDPHVERALAICRTASGGQPQLPHPLSDREMEVIRLLPSRLSNAEMAEALFVSTNTVKTHLKHIYQKLDAENRNDAIRRARDAGLL